MNRYRNVQMYYSHTKNLTHDWMNNNMHVEWTHQNHRKMKIFSLRMFKARRQRASSFCIDPDAPNLWNVHFVSLGNTSIWNKNNVELFWNSAIASHRPILWIKKKPCGILFNLLHNKEFNFNGFSIAVYRQRTIQEKKDKYYFQK